MQGIKAASFTSTVLQRPPKVGDISQLQDSLPKAGVEDSTRTPQRKKGFGSEEAEVLPTRRAGSCPKEHSEMPDHPPSQQTGEGEGLP